MSALTGVVSRVVALTGVVSAFVPFVPALRRLDFRRRENSQYLGVV